MAALAALLAALLAQRLVVLCFVRALFLSQVHSNYVDTVAFLGNGTLVTKCCGNQAFQMMWWGIMMSRESFIKTPTGDGHGDVLPLAELMVPDCQQWFVRHAVSPNRRYVALGTDHGGVYVYDLHMLADAAAKADASAASSSSSSSSSARGGSGAARVAGTDGESDAAAGAPAVGDKSPLSSTSSPVSSAAASTCSVVSPTASPASSSTMIADAGSSSAAAAGPSAASPTSTLGVFDEARAAVSAASGAAEPDEARVAAVAAQLASIVDGNALIPTDVRVTLTDAEKAAIVAKALAVSGVASGATTTTPGSARGRGRGGRGKAASGRLSHSSAGSSAAAAGGAASSSSPASVASASSAAGAAAASGTSCAAASASGFDTAAHLEATLRTAVAGGVGLLAESPSVPQLYPYTTLIHYNSTQQVRQVAFTSDSRTIIAVSGDGLVLRWDIDDGSRTIRKYVPSYNWTADKPGGTRAAPSSKGSGVPRSSSGSSSSAGAAGSSSGGASAAPAPSGGAGDSDDVYIKPDPGGMAAETDVSVPETAATAVAATVYVAPPPIAGADAAALPPPPASS